jgi:potassium channel subfamily K
MSEKLPRTLVNEFIERRKTGEPLGTSLKEAIFQAKSSIGVDQEDVDDGSKFQFWKVEMRGLVDDDPV